MVSSSNETRRVVGNSELIKKLTDCANHINMSEPLPLEHAILRHVTYTLAIVSEELLCAETLANSGCLELCFRVVVGENEERSDDDASFLFPPRITNIIF